jgi:hypothetical protein
MKQSREKLLLFAFVGILAVWQGQALFHAIFIAPREQREIQLGLLNKDVTKLELEQRRFENARTYLKELQNRSLPAVPVAQSQYQPWLIELATQSKLTGVSVEGLTGTAQPKGGTYYSITGTVIARGTLDRICDFLHAFHQAGLLHRITGIKLVATKHEGNPAIDATISVEGLTLVNSPSRTTLFADAKNPPKPGVPLKDRKDFDSITSKNLFVSTYKPVKAPEKTPERPKSPIEALPDTAEFVYLVASLASGAERDATLFDRTSAKETKLTAGSSFNIAGLSGKVVSIHDDYVVVEVEGDKWQLDLGKNLRQMRKL